MAKRLRTKGILRYDSNKFTWFVDNLDDLVTDYLKRINREKPYPTEWDYQRELKRNPLNHVSSPYYRLPTGLADDLVSMIDELKMKKIGRRTYLYSKGNSSIKKSTYSFF